MRSDEVKKGFDRTPHRSLLRATGLKDEDFDKPFIGVANSFIELIPGHFFLDKVSDIIKASRGNWHRYNGLNFRIRQLF